MSTTSSSVNGLTKGNHGSIIVNYTPFQLIAKITVDGLINNSSTIYQNLTVSDINLLFLYFNVNTATNLNTLGTGNVLLNGVSILTGLSINSNKIYSIDTRIILHNQSLIYTPTLVYDANVYQFDISLFKLGG